MATIECKALRKTYSNIEVVRDFNLQVADREFIVFLGPSGCGKSTILRMLAGLELISDGELKINGRVVNNTEPSERGIAMVFQNYALYPHMTIFDNIAFGLKRVKTPKEEINVRVESVAKMLGLAQYLERKPAELSGGQQQRVAIARAMIKTPDVFPFDEPLSNLDAKLRAHMRFEISKLHKELKTTSVYVTHDQMEAMTLADRIVLLNDGNIEQIGSPQEIYERPKSLFVADFIGSPAMNFLNASVCRDGSGWKINGTGFTFNITGDSHQLKENQSIIVGIRPSKLRLDINQAVGNHLSGESNQIDFLGDDVLIGFRVDDTQLFGMSEVHNQPGEGAQVSFSASENDLHIFDENTKLSLLKLS